MGGGLMQLVAYGAQDIYLTGNSQITFFKVVYRRHTNFAMEAIEQTFPGNPDFGKKVACTISRNGDLIHKVWVQMTLLQVNVPAGGRFRWLNDIGHFLLKTIEIEIGGQSIDKHYGDWLHIWSELSICPGHKAGFDKMIGNVPALTKVYDNPTAAGATTMTVHAYTLYVPLEFWFCQNPGLALPLIALHNASLPISNLNATMYVNYLYLDTEERRRFAQNAGIQWFNYTDAYDTTYKDIPSYPFLTVNSANDGTTTNQPEDIVLAPFEKAGKNPTVLAKLLLNGHDRFSERPGDYFNWVQPYQHHQNVPSTGINVYSFSLKPEEHQPSGSCNFSRIDNATLQLTLSNNFKSTTGKFRIYAVNYNVRRIMSGMGGMAYSN
eukprot:gene19672-biopygen28499